jgi:hypothetical protein
MGRGGSTALNHQNGEFNRLFVESWILDPSLEGFGRPDRVWTGSFYNVLYVGSLRNQAWNLLVGPTRFELVTP